MSYDDPDPSHRNALAQVNEARQRALLAVEEIRQQTVGETHENLAPAQDGSSLAKLANQRVVSYLLQLRPYRANSQKWQTDLGQLELPRKLRGDPPKRRGGDPGPPYRLCRQPAVSLSPVSHLVELINTDIVYSTSAPTDPDPNLGGDDMWTVRFSAETLRVPKDQALAFHEGAISRDELRRVAEPEGGDTGSNEFQPSTPLGGEIKRFKLVFGPDRLLQLVELADEVAGEIGMLAEFEDPDHTAGGGGAV